MTAYQYGPGSIAEALDWALKAPFVGSNNLELRDSFELLEARRFAVQNFAQRLAEHFEDDVQKIEGMICAMSSNLGPSIDSPQGQASIATTISIWLGKETYPSFVHKLH